MPAVLARLVPATLVAFAAFAPQTVAVRAAAAAAAAAADAPTPLTERQRIVHALNRLGYGPRPGDVERVERMGLDAYVCQQLAPESIDDAAADQAVAVFETLNRSSKQLGEQYFADVRRFLAKQAADGNRDEMKMRYGLDPSRVQAGKGNAATKPAQPTLDEVASWEALRCVGELQQAKVMRAVLSERQLREVLVDFWTNHFNVDIRKDACRVYYVAYDRDAIRPHAMGKFRDLLGAVAHSPAMLTYLDNQENSRERKISGFERKVAEWYIGRKLGVDASGMVPDKSGPNENYARELLELHTLGVDGGYTQKDVQEVARCFSGWGVNPFTGKFGYDGNKHDDGAKIVLGTTIPAKGGQKDGDRVLDLLASHPSTAKFIARKLCQRFVSDEPPPDLVETVAKVFTASEGDVRQVVRAIVTSRQFYAPAAYRAKIKSPLEYAASAVRATGLSTRAIPLPLWQKLLNVKEGVGTLGYEADKLTAETKKSLNWHVHDMGQPLLAHAAPTGYPEQSSKWVGPGALIGRLNFAVALSEGSVTDVHGNLRKLARGVDADQPEAVLDRLSQALLHGEMTPATRATLLKSAVPEGGQGKTVDVAKLTALILGSPEFQRR